MQKKLLALLISFLVASASFATTPNGVIYTRKNLVNPRSNNRLEESITRKTQKQQTNSIRSFAAAYRPALMERFLKYVSYNRQSSETEPITTDEIATAHKLYDEIKAMGLDVTLSEHYYIFVEIPSNISRDVPVLGYSGHYDVTPGIEANNVNSRVISAYNGKSIALENNQVIDPTSTRDTYLSQQVGKTVVTSDGNTILGADDGAGLSILMTFLQTLVENPTIAHGKIQIVLAPNEDVGRAAEFVEETPYRPDIAFDFDGGSNGRVATENFNARQEILVVEGVPGHQSYAATNGYRNAWLPACKLALAVCPEETLPNYSTGRTGYAEPHHMYPFEDKIYKAAIDIRLRDFDAAVMDAWEARTDAIAAQIAKEEKVKITRIMIDNYRNVAECAFPAALEITQNAAKTINLKINLESVRAGTTASMFVTKGIVGAYTIFTGQNNPHNYTEWLSEEDMYFSYLLSLSLMQEVANYVPGK